MQLNLKDLTEAERSFYGRHIPDYARLRRTNAEILVTVDNDGMYLSHRIIETHHKGWGEMPAPKAELKTKHVPEPKTKKYAYVKKEGWGLTDMQKKTVTNLYAEGYGMAKIVAFSGATEIQANNYIAYNLQNIIPKLTDLMVARVRELWLQGGKAKTIAIKLEYNFFLVAEKVAAIRTDLDGEKPRQVWLTQSDHLRIDTMQAMGLDVAEMAKRIDVKVEAIRCYLRSKKEGECTTPE